MPLHKVEADANSVTLWESSDRPKEQTKAQSQSKMPVGDRNDLSKVAQQMADDLQEQMDVRQPISGLPNDDPDKTTNPRRSDLFWDGSDLVGRSVLVEIVWDGKQFVPTITRV